MAEVKISFDADDDHERFMGRWSRAIGETFLAWLFTEERTLARCRLRHRRV